MTKRWHIESCVSIGESEKRRASDDFVVSLYISQNYGVFLQIGWYPKRDSPYRSCCFFFWGGGGGPSVGNNIHRSGCWCFFFAVVAFIDWIQNRITHRFRGKLISPELELPFKTYLSLTSSFFFPSQVDQGVITLYTMEIWNNAQIWSNLYGIFFLHMCL